MAKIIIYTDGGARGNPGPAGIGAVIYDEKMTEMHRISQFIGNATNNQAEYKAAIEALRWVSELHVGVQVDVFVDSELLARQFQGWYKVKNSELKDLYVELLEQVKNLGLVKFQSIPRAQNKVADQLVNEAIDKAQSQLPTN